MYGECVGLGCVDCRLLRVWQVCRTFGRSYGSTSFLRAFSQQVPQSWQLQEQQERNQENDEVDLVLEEQLLEDGTLEAEDCSFVSELTMMVNFPAEKDDEGRMKQVRCTGPAQQGGA